MKDLANTENAENAFFQLKFLADDMDKEIAAATQVTYFFQSMCAVAS